ncbi:glycoside hydrolase family 39 protein [Dichotomopilus funicola]|uniref:Glycoside hydrolase family 39 protein n=1 Tax=Dichotomopilus funicola TaxID=1934379 RepID=A0AAN6UUV4_9PEZI|nr:glycoside hydrolase family 39 protein [Dichotomopilus funicola]
MPRLALVPLLALVASGLSLPSLVQGGSLGEQVAKRQDRAGTATVSLSQASGTPAYLASGFIYGIPDNSNQVSTQIPDHFFTDIKFQYCRAGGAQLPVPSRGWIYGIEEYRNRFGSALSNYRTTRKFGARFILLVHDLWGADSTQGTDAPYPGDNGDWTSYDRYLTQLISDLKANNMLEGLDIDIWNEPDGSLFWTRTVEQWTAMWNRALPRFRNELPGVIIMGPSISNPPSPGHKWWDGFGAAISRSGNIPDVYSWHSLSYPLDPQLSAADIATWRNKYGLPARPQNINEYGAPDEQSPAHSAWHISRLERNNIRGLRANWASVYELHDYMGNLLGKPGAGTTSYNPHGQGYYPAGEWHVYKYYGTNMTGTRVATAGSADRAFDVYATRGSTANSVKILASSRGADGIWDIKVTGLDAVGLPVSGSVSTQTWRFDYKGKYGEVGTPVNLGVVVHQYSNNEVWVPGLEKRAAGQRR